MFYKKKKMVEQNNINNQSVWWNIQGWNPFDLVDNQNIQSNQNQQAQQNVVSQNSNWTQTNWWQINQDLQQNPVQNQNMNVNSNVSVQNQWQVPKQNSNEYKGPSGFMKSLIKFIAKISGQPDPETGKWVQVQSQQPVQDGSVSNNNQVSNKPKNAFDSIMSGVTWILDTVEKKVENATWVNLDTPVSNVNQNVPNSNIQQNQNLQQQWVPTNMQNNTIQQNVWTQPQIQQQTNDQNVDGNIQSWNNQTQNVQNEVVQQTEQNQVSQNEINQSQKVQSAPVENSSQKVEEVQKLDNQVQNASSNLNWNELIQSNQQKVEEPKVVENTNQSNNFQDSGTSSQEEKKDDLNKNSSVDGDKENFS